MGPSWGLQRLQGQSWCAGFAHDWCDTACERASGSGGLFASGPRGHVGASPCVAQAASSRLPAFPYNGGERPNGEQAAGAQARPHARVRPTTEGTSHAALREKDAAGREPRCPERKRRPGSRPRGGASAGSGGGGPARRGADRGAGSCRADGRTSAGIRHGGGARWRRHRPRDGERAFAAARKRPPDARRGAGGFGQRLRTDPRHVDALGRRGRAAAGGRPSAPVRRGAVQRAPLCGDAVVRPRRRHSARHRGAPAHHGQDRHGALSGKRPRPAAASSRRASLHGNAGCRPGGGSRAGGGRFGIRARPRMRGGRKRRRGRWMVPRTCSPSR